jgi:SpoVK/Ycf46/Vps4 family AAA+-type ATPase
MSSADNSLVMRSEPAYDEFLVHLARLSLSGRDQDVATYLQRVARKLRTTNPHVADALVTVLRDSPTRMSPLRSASSSPMPVDMDSRLPLLRIDTTGVESVEPILDESARQALTQVIAERHHRNQLFDAGLNPSQAALFVGAPGLGKTMAARWIAAELGVPLAVLDLSSVMSSLLGKTGMNLRHAFDYAKQSECVLLLDELDAIGKRRGDDSDVGELKRLVTVLLQQIDDWPPSAGLILGATNHPELLDAAVWRRFDVTVTFGQPDLPMRETAIRRFSDGQLGDAAISILAMTTDGWSFSDIERRILTIRRNAVVHKADPNSSVFELIRSAAHAERLAIARTLAAHDEYSQRAISELTGVSRDTVRRLRDKACDH